MTTHSKEPWTNHKWVLRVAEEHAIHLGADAEKAEIVVKSKHKGQDVYIPDSLQKGIERHKENLLKDLYLQQVMEYIEERWVGKPTQEIANDMHAISAAYELPLDFHAMRIYVRPRAKAVMAAAKKNARETQKNA